MFRLRCRLSIAAGSLFATLPLLIPTSAEAVVVNVDGINFDIVTFDTSYVLNSADFSAPPVGRMPWWGDDSQASKFAEQVYNQLGSGSLDSDYGPVFAYESDPIFFEVVGLSQSLSDINIQFDEFIPDFDVVTYAITIPTSVPVPTPLPLFGVATAYQWSRSLKKRCKLSQY